MRCHVCNGAELVLLADLGPQAVGNRYMSSPEVPQTLIPLAVGQCPLCAIIQLLHLATPDELRSPFPWVTYNEPEGHLDALTDVLLSLEGVGPDTRVVGLTYKDDSTLDRLRARGLKHVHRLDVAGDIGATEPNAGLESIQAHFTVERARSLVSRQGSADLFLVRHIAEHAHDPRAFLSAVAAMLSPGGYAVFEVPDCTRALRCSDVTTIWEEHVLYLTPATLVRLVELAGYEVVTALCYEYSNENSLNIVVRVGSAMARDNPTADELTLGRNFARGLEARAESVRRAVRDAAQRGKVAMFGAGHLACTFIGATGIARDLSFVIDDHPQKRGMFMPGSGLPIVGSDALQDPDVVLCLSSLSPESEAKVLARNADFVTRGGAFHSIFPGTTRALPI